VRRAEAGERRLQVSAGPSYSRDPLRTSLAAAAASAQCASKTSQPRGGDLYAARRALALRLVRDICEPHPHSPPPTSANHA
jgi:hypothetical protein